MNKPTKLQRAGRNDLLRLVAELGPLEAARMLRALADEIEAQYKEARATGADNWFSDS
jgi:hypothetical protein